MYVPLPLSCADEVAGGVVGVLDDQVAAAVGQLREPADGSRRSN